MNMTVRTLMIPILLASGTACAASAGSTIGRPQSKGIKDYTCTFGRYGPITVHEGGIGRTWIIVDGRKYPATGGNDYIQADDDDGVGLTYDLKGRLYYKAEVPGKDCRVNSD